MAECIRAGQAKEAEIAQENAMYEAMEAEEKVDRYWAEEAEKEADEECWERRAE